MISNARVSNALDRNHYCSFLVGILTCVLFVLLPVTSFASGHSTQGLDGLEGVIVLVGATFVLAFLNLITLILVAFSRKGAPAGLLWTCLPFNLVLLLYAIDCYASRYREHLVDQRFGADVDRVGFANYSAKADGILFVILATIVLDIFLIWREKGGHLLNPPAQIP